MKCSDVSARHESGHVRKQRENGIREWRYYMSDDNDENEIMLAALLIVTSRKTGLPLDRYRVFSGNSFTPFCCAK
ncbi:unnamed protein product [Lasius platythorax]|uniref:Uncharacterized protein n=1 Tax=Lasius platythorax TaxID=488582 RepID=A0AAV2NZZ0_9HYME